LNVSEGRVYLYLMNKDIGTMRRPRGAGVSQARKIHVNLSESVHQKLRVKCALRDTTIQDFVSSLITHAVGDVRLENADARAREKSR